MLLKGSCAAICCGGTTGCVPPHSIANAAFSVCMCIRASRCLLTISAGFDFVIEVNCDGVGWTWVKKKLCDSPGGT